MDEVFPRTPPSVRGSVENNSEKGFLNLCLNSRSLNEFLLNILDFPIS